MLDLHNAGEKKEGDKNASGSSAVAVKSKKKGKRSRGGRSDKVGAILEGALVPRQGYAQPYCRFCNSSPRSSPCSSCARS